MLRLRTKSALAPAVATALLRGCSDASEAELAVVERSVLEGLQAMPDTLRFGVRAMSVMVDGTLVALAGGDFRNQPVDVRSRLAGRLSTLPLPGMAEFVRLTRGLGLVCLYEGREDTGSGPRPDSLAG